MDLHLGGRTAFISGSSGGIGYAIADALAAEGASVVINGRNQQRLDIAVRRLRDEHPLAEITGLAADFANADEVARLVQALGDIDILINNVGVFDIAEFASTDDAEWARYLEVNLMSGVRLSRALLGGMLSRNRGRIVFISSESGVNVPADMIHYGVTKAAMLALGNGLAKLTRGSAVTVNSVLGGPTLSDGVHAAIVAVAETQSVPVEQVMSAIVAANRTTLLERFIEPSEIAALVTYLASPLASATNGAVLRADGGILTATL